MKYERILSYVAAEPWAIHPAKLQEILSVLAFRASGETFSADDIQARIGGGASPATLGRAQGGAVAIVPVRGTIAHRMGGMMESSGGASTEAIAAMFRQAMSDEAVGTVVLDVDSPGGTVTGVSELAAEVFNARGQGKRIVAMVNGMAASAAYWIAAQADEIVSLPSGMAGSIGVFSAHQDLSAALEQEGVKVTLISAGKYKVEGNPFEPLSDDAKAFMQARVDDAYGQFVKDVARGRGVSPADVRKGYGEGRTLSAKDAKAAGLVDRIATMDETLGRLMGRKVSASGGVRAEVTESEDGRYLTASIDMAEGVTSADVIVTVDESDRLRRMERF
jgi:signal peptide peptidase SppA